MSGWHTAGVEEQLSDQQMESLDVNVLSVPVVRWLDDGLLQVTSCLMSGRAHFTLTRDRLSTGDSVVLYRGYSFIEAVQLGNLRAQEKVT